MILMPMVSTLVAQLAACVDCCNQCGVGSRVELSLWQYVPAVSIVVIVALTTSAVKTNGIDACYYIE